MENWRKHTVTRKLLTKHTNSGSKNFENDKYSEINLLNIFKGKQELSGGWSKRNSAMDRYSRNSIALSKIIHNKSNKSTINSYNNDRKTPLKLSLSNSKVSKTVISEPQTDTLEKRARAILKKSMQNSIERGNSYAKYTKDVTGNFSSSILPYIHQEQRNSVTKISHKRSYAINRNLQHKRLSKSITKTEDHIGLDLMLDKDPYSNSKELEILQTIKKESAEMYEKGRRKKFSINHEIIIPKSLKNDSQFKEYVATSYEYKAAFKVCQKSMQLRNTDENKTIEGFVQEFFPGYSKKKQKNIINLLNVREFPLDSNSIFFDFYWKSSIKYTEWTIWRIFNYL